MPRFIATHTIPFTEDALVKHAKEEAPKFLETGTKWIRTHCDFNTNNFFCEWEAPNKEAIEKIFKDLNIPKEGLFLVRIFDVAAAKLED